LIIDFERADVDASPGRLPKPIPWDRAFLIRAFEERLLKLFSEGKLFGTVHTCIGQEFTGIAAAAHLEAGDLIFSNHRCHGHYLARTGDVDGLMAEIMGRSTGICGGRGGSQHICATASSAMVFRAASLLLRPALRSLRISRGRRTSPFVLSGTELLGKAFCMRR
jgi:hypothetical protein